jgi:hypothetical protein
MFGCLSLPDNNSAALCRGKYRFTLPQRSADKRDRGLYDD